MLKGASTVLRGPGAGNRVRLPDVRPQRGNVSAFDIVVKQQVAWARNRGLHPDVNGYLPDVLENMFVSLSAETEAAYRAAAGNELTDRDGERAKMRALHSSSALVCNAFEYWRTNLGAIARGLGIAESISKIQFEAQLPTGLRGTAPTLDLLLISSEELAWGVESKFTEPFQGRHRNQFAASYFASDAGLWHSRGLPECEVLARRLHSGDLAFAYLDAHQLLKHALGIRRKYRNGKLILLWHDPGTSESTDLEKEIQVFAEAIDATLGFRALSYHRVFDHLAQEEGSHDAYLDYVRSRYLAV